jgi:hypothetical protein
MPETNSGFHQQINNLSQDNEVKDMRHCQDEVIISCTDLDYFNAVIHTNITIFHKWRESGCATVEKRLCVCVDIPILITSTILYMYNFFILQFVFPVVFHISIRSTDFISTRCNQEKKIKRRKPRYVCPLRNHQCFMQGEHPTLQ